MRGRSLIIGLVVVFAAGVAVGQYNVSNYTEQGGARTVIGGSLDVVSGGDLDVESGAALKLAGTAVTSSAAELNAVDGLTGVLDSPSGTTLTIGASPAATCTAGSIHIDTDESVDTNCTTTADNALCYCVATDTWAANEP